MNIKAGQVVTLKREYLEPGEENPPHVAIEDAFDGTVRVELAGEYKYALKPINTWLTDWIAD